MSDSGHPPRADLDDPLPSIAGGSARLLIARVIASAATFVAFLILARTLVPSERGPVAFVMTTGLILAGISGFGLDSATTVFASRWTRTRSSLLTNLYLFSLAAAALVGGLAAVALALAPSVRPAGVEGAELAALLVGTVALRAIGSSGAFLLGCGRFREQVLVYSAGPVSLTCFLAVAWLIDDIGVGAACGLWAASQVLGAVVGLVAVLYVQRPGRVSMSLAKRTFDFGLRAWGGTIAGFLNARLDQVIMGLISTEVALGIYAVATNASEVSLYLSETVGLALLPAVARATGAERVETTLRTFRALLLVTTGIVAIGVMCSPLIPIVFGSDYEPSVAPYLLRLPGAIPFVAIRVFTSALGASLAPGRSSIPSVTALVVGIALDFALIPQYGANGAAVAATAAFTTGGIVAATLYCMLAGTGPRDLIPHRSDFATVRGLLSRSVRRRSSDTKA